MSELTPGERLALAKKEVNGDYKDVIIANQEHTYMVYQPDGNILYKGLTEPDMSTYDNCKSYKFNTQDVAITDQQGKSIAQFIIHEDEHEVCHIKVRSLEVAKTKASRDFLSEITSTSKAYDILFSTTKNDWKISKNAKLVLKQPMSFYVTPLKDPHILLERIVVSPEMFKDSNVVKIKHKDTLPEAYSVYTHKIFENYSIK